jgi:acetyl-CoA carboxylase carboxyl transferase subunit alpha
MVLAPFDFEKPILELERQIEELTPNKKDSAVSEKIKKLEDELLHLKVETYSNLTPWQRVQMARHMARPHSLDYIKALFSNWTEIHGDRNFADDQALVTGFGNFRDRPVTIIGQQKGKDTKENLARNFGMMHPEGYRKAMRVMRIGEKFNLPIIILIDTPGAYPGIGAEERGQAMAIAQNIFEMSGLSTPIVILITGEGCSGGMLGMGVGDRFAMLENAYFSVISPEGCAAILWRSADVADKAAEAMKVTAQDMLELGVIDAIIEEPPGGAHRDAALTASNIAAYLARTLAELSAVPIDRLREERYEKYRSLGSFTSV